MDTKKCIVLPVDGAPRLEEHPTDLVGLQQAVGGYIEQAYVYEDPDEETPSPAACLILNEEGAYTGLAPNATATTLARGQVLMPALGMVGNVLVFGSHGGELTDVPAWVVERLGLTA